MIRRRKRPKAGSGGEAPERERKPRPPACQGCLRLTVARDAAIERLLVLLEEPEHRAALEQSHGLCLKHFAQAYILVPQGKIRSLLTGVHVERLADLQSRLRTVPAISVRADPAGNLPATPAWQLAIQRFCGDFWPLGSPTAIAEEGIASIAAQ